MLGLETGGGLAERQDLSNAPTLSSKHPFPKANIASVCKHECWHISGGIVTINARNILF